jgi:hypothetical protein
VLITREGSRNCFECSVIYIFGAMSERATRCSSSDRSTPSLHREIAVNRRVAHEAEVSASRMVLGSQSSDGVFPSENKLRL